MIVARTWNQNPSGLLWEAFWHSDEGRYWKKSVCSGVFPPADHTEYADAEAFWAAFEADAERFYGQRTEKAAP